MSTPSALYPPSANGNGKASRFMSKEALASLPGLLAMFQSNGPQQDEITSFNQIDRTLNYTPLTLNYQRLLYLFKGAGVMQAAIEVPVFDAFRGGIDIHEGEMDADDIGGLHKAIQHTGMMTAYAKVKCWARLFGGAGLIVNTEVPPDRPLTRTQLAGKVSFYAASRWELTSETGVKPPLSALDSYAINRSLWAAADSEFFYFYGTRIHKSRVLIVNGKEAPYLLKWQLQGWGMSEYERYADDYQIFSRTKTVLFELLKKAKQDIYQFDGLNDLTSSDQGTAQFFDRVATMNQLANYQDAIALDALDKFETHQLTFAGLAEVMKMNMQMMSCSTRIPMNKLFGESASGLNASGEDSIENYNAMVESEVREPSRADITKLLEMLCDGLFGSVPEFSWEFKPLRIMSAKDEEEIKTSKLTRTLSLFQAALLTSYEVGQICEKEKLVPIETEMAAGNLEDHPLAPMQEAMGLEKEEGEKKEKAA